MDCLEVLLDHLEVVEVPEQAFVQVLAVGGLGVDADDVEVDDFVHGKTLLLVEQALLVD